MDMRLSVDQEQRAMAIMKAVLLVWKEIRLKSQYKLFKRREQYAAI